MQKFCKVNKNKLKINKKLKENKEINKKHKKSFYKNIYKMIDNTYIIPLIFTITLSIYYNTLFPQIAGGDRYILRNIINIVVN